MDALVFGEFCEHLSSILQKAMDDENKDDTLSLNSLMKLTKPDPKTPKPEDEEEFLKLHDGNYLKAKEAAEAGADWLQPLVPQQRRRDEAAARIFGKALDLIIWREKKKMMNKV